MRRTINKRNAVLWCTMRRMLVAGAMASNGVGVIGVETFAQELEPPSQSEASSTRILAQASGKPATRDSLFEDDPPAAAKPKAAPATKPSSRDSLFEDSPPAADKPKSEPGGKAPSRDSLFEDTPPAEQPASGPGWRGYFEAAAARTYPNPDHWSKARLRADITRQGQFSENVKYKIGARADYDAAYDRSAFYAPDVRRDQRYEFVLRENYLDISTGGNWEIRLGRQHVVWGELVGLFIADVVSARDLREFILPEPELQSLRTPQWAARAEYFGKDWKAELLWIPIASYDDIGKPGIPGVRGAAGADFYPYPIPGPGGSVFLDEDIPTRKLSNSNYGARFSALKSGWDFSGFYYRSLDISPNFYRQVLPRPAPDLPVFQYQARHDRISQVGGTVSKDLGNAVFKAEGVYTTGRKFNVTRLDQPNGLVEQDIIDYALGLDYTLPRDARLNLQFFQRIHLDHDPDTLLRKYETGVSVLFDALKLATNVEGRLLLVHSLNRSDWLVRPKVTWTFEKNWRLALGADVFGGPPQGLFGRYDNNDRVYTELRYSF
jgi:Protein of unknown function (DUF1302)